MSNMGPSVWDPVPARTVATRADLSGASIPNPVSGALVYVDEVSDTYRLELQNGLPVDGLNVLATTLGGLSRWIKLNLPSFDPVVGGVPVSVTKTPNAAGVSAFASRSDHKHDVTTAAPGTILPDAAPAEGVATTLARSDHVHGIVADTPGFILPDDAPAEGVAASFARSDHIHGIVAAVPGSILPDDVPAEGVALSFSRSDHVHGIAAAVPVPIGAALAEGVSTSFARADHVHTGGVLPNGAALFWGNASAAATTTTRFLTPGFGDSGLAPTSPIRYRIPFAGTLKNLRVRHNTPAGNGNAIVYTVRINSVVTLLSVSMASTATDGSDLVNTVVVAAGDLVDIQITKALAVGAAPNDVMAILQVAG